MRWVLTLLLVAASASAATVNWTNTVYQSGALADGDTLNLWGTFTNQLRITNQPLTVVFQTGSKFSAPTWTTLSFDGSQKAILDLSALTSAHDIRIDGSGTGVIEATDNGFGLTYSNSICGIYCPNSSSNVVIANLSILNLGQRRTNDWDCATTGYGEAIRFTGNMTNLYVFRCSITNVANGIVWSMSSGYSGGFYAISNNLINSSWGCYNEGSAANVTRSNLYFQWNTVDNGTNWAGCPGVFHQDGLITGVSGANGQTWGTYIDHNRFGPGPDIGTAAIFVESTQLGTNNHLVFIHDNLIHSTNGFALSPGFIVVKGDGIYVFNNTIYYAGGSGSGLLLDAMDGAVGPAVLNNIVLAGNAWVWNYPSTTNFVSDYNVWWSAVYDDQFFGSNFMHWSAWTNAYPWADQHSTTNPPLLTASYRPATNDTVASGLGTNLTALYASLGLSAVDLAGAARPASAAWTIGAFEPEGTPPIPVASFTGSPLSGCVPLLVSFFNASTDSTNYLWNFGDAVTATTTNPTHSYPTASVYTVSLRAIGPGGTNTLTRSGYITVTNAPAMSGAFNINVLIVSNLVIGGP